VLCPVVVIDACGLARLITTTEPAVAFVDVLIQLK